MSREPIIKFDADEHVPEENKEDGANWNLRPRTIEEYVGQTHVVESLAIAMGADQARGEP